MNSTRTALCRWTVRTAIVGAAFAGAASFTTAAATSASAVVKNPNTLCADHGGVDVILKGWIICADGEEFEVGYPI